MSRYRYKFVEDAVRGLGAVPAHLLRARVVPRHLGAAAAAHVPALDDVALPVDR